MEKKKQTIRSKKKKTNSAKPTIVYKYGALESDQNGDRIGDQMRLAHRYYNQLIEIERARKEATWAVLESMWARVYEIWPEYKVISNHHAEVCAAVDDLAEQIKTERKRSRKRAVPKAMTAELRALKRERTTLNNTIACARGLAYQLCDAKQQLVTVNEDAKQKLISARAHCDVYWGTYLQVEDAVDQAKETARGLPDFRRWRGDGKLAVQLQGGLSPEEAFACKDRRLRIEPLHPNAFDKGQPRSLRRTRVWMRIGSEGRDPVWAVVPVTMHRPLPSECTIKWVFLTRRRVACHDKWAVCFVISRDEPWTKPDLASSGKVGIDVGWRMMPDGDLRVARYRGDDGVEGELRIPSKDVSRWTKVKSLRGIRDNNFNTIIGVLSDWLEGAGDDVPEWLRDKLRHLGQWRAQRRLASVVLLWRDERFPGDEQIFDRVEAWRKQDKHLYEWEQNNLRKAIAWRLDFYRCWVADLSRRYTHALIENTDWSELRRLPEVEDDGEQNTNYMSSIASVGALLELIKNRFASHTKKAAEYTTLRCHHCNQITKFDTAKHLSHQCEHCGTKWDQDVNAARNLLASGQAESSA